MLRDGKGRGLVALRNIVTIGMGTQAEIEVQCSLVIFRRERVHVLQPVRRRSVQHERGHVLVHLGARNTAVQARNDLVELFCAAELHTGPRYLRTRVRLDRCSVTEAIYSDAAQQSG